MNICIATSTFPINRNEVYHRYIDEFHIGKINEGLNGTLNSTRQKVLDSIKTKPNIKAKEIASILDIPIYKLRNKSKIK